MDSVIVFCAQYLIVVVLLIPVLVWLTYPPTSRIRFALTIIIAGIIAIITARIASKLYYDPRPFVTQHIRPLINHPADNGFPSDHALLTMTLTAAVYFFSKKAAAAMLALTVIVGTARILAHVHSPIDILGAWLIGAASAGAAYVLCLRLARLHLVATRLKKG